MYGKILTITLTILLLNLALAGPVQARAAQETAATSAVEKIKAEVGRLGAGTPVTVKLTNGTKLTGKVGEADEEGFMVVDAKSSRTRVAYTEVKSVKRFKKSGWKTFEPKDVAFAAGLFGGIFLLAIWAANQTR
jgi:small nuclear ribonucleoprotein (snRNP)-like protein